MSSINISCARILGVSEGGGFGICDGGGIYGTGMGGIGFAANDSYTGGENGSGIVILIECECAFS